MITKFAMFTILVFAAQNVGAQAGLTAMPKDLEIKYALSALPQQFRDQATVLTLNPKKGYEKAKVGNNAFTCIVERTEWARQDHRDDVFVPLCYDKEGTKNHLQVWIDVAQLRAKNEKAEKIAATISSRFKSGYYKAPKGFGFSYMIGPVMRTYTNPDPADKTVVTFPMPHVMYYAPNLSNEEVGGVLPPGALPFVFEPGPHGYVVQMLGQTETQNIIKQESQLLGELCEFNKVLCLNGSAQHSH